MIDIKAIKTKYPVLAVIHALQLEGNRKANEFVALNPTRDDNSPRSFSINIITGIWKDFATGEPGGDIVDLWKYIRGCGTLGAAAKQLDDTLAGRFDLLEEFADHQPPKPAERWEIVMPAIIGERTKPHPIRWKHNDELPERPDTIYTYLARNGQDILGFVCRWDPPEGGKEIRPRFMFKAPDGHLRWRWQGPIGDDPRPIYHLERLEAKPKTCWWVEGEKAADAGQAFAPDATVVVSWLGGSSTAKYVDVGHCRGMHCILIPDRDAQRNKAGEMLPYAQQPGVKAMNEIAKKLLAIGCKVSMVDYEIDESMQGWDLADAHAQGWTPQQVQEMVRTGLRDLPVVTTETVHRPESFGKSPLWSTLRLDTFSTLGTNGKPLNTWQTFHEMFNAYGITCRDNLLTQNIELRHVPSERTIDVEDVISLCSYNQIQLTHYKDHIRKLARMDPYHPVVDWIKSRPWDGTSRMADMFGTIHLGESDPVLSAKLFFRWCISAVAMVTQERMDSTGARPAAQGVLVLVGSQDLNKSRWVSSLAPAAFVRAGANLDPRDKDSLIKSTTAWLVEWAEIVGTKNATSIALVKGHVTGDTEFIRKPYAPEAIERPRRTVYIGTENNDDYLVDDTGNRRWWSIRVRGLNVNHGIDTQQFWAEVYQAFKDGAPWWLVDDEKQLLAGSNAKHEHVSPIEELLEGGLRWDEPARTWETATTILTALGFSKPTSGDCKRAARFLRRLGCETQEIPGRPLHIKVPIARVLR